MKNARSQENVWSLVRAVERPNRWICLYFLSTTILPGCGKGTTGDSCRYQSDCAEACSYNPAPDGPGTCGPYRRVGESCTRPGYALNDCAPGLSCSSSAVCVSAGSGGGGCSPRCASSASCVDINGVSTCLPLCSTNSDCPLCCIQTTNGTRVCAPSSSFCGSPGSSCCTGRVCGPNTCGSGSCGTCSAGFTCSNAGQCTSTPSTCRDAADCIAFLPAPTTTCFANRYNIVNRCGVQVACRISRSDGTRGCVYPIPGTNECATSTSPGVTLTFSCTIGPRDPCSTAIGCGL